MLESIYQLGLAQKDNYSSLLTPANARYVVAMVFTHKNDQLKYVKSELFEFDNPSLYLYKRDYSGRPGLFLTGNISGQDIDKIKKILGGNMTKIGHTEVKKFIENKILWFSKGKIVTDYLLLNNLTPKKREELVRIWKEMDIKQEKIAKDVIKILTKDRSERTLITIMIQEDSQQKFVGQIKEYVDLFKKGVLSRKYESNEELYCAVCNKKTIIETFTEKPLPFFTADKPMFFPDADPTQSKKGFPLCENCYLEIQKGIQFIGENLNYSISALGSKRSELNFWLIPQLNDPDLIIHLQKELKNKDLYLNSLKNLCNTLDTVSKFDFGDKNVETFLRFSALFYYIDSHALMRVINYIQGIYPQRLQKLLDVKDRIDKKPIFLILEKRFKNSVFRVGFPLLVFFIKEADAQWQGQIISLLEKIFTGERIPIEKVLQNINEKIRETSLKSFKINELCRTSFLGLLLAEYLINLNGDLTERKQLSTKQETPIKEVKQIQDFIETHQEILSDTSARAIFAVGVTVGILLEVQGERYGKTAPFWNRLNRLNLDLERIQQLFPEVKSKLAMYGETRYDIIINYLGANEVSQLDKSAQIPKESINFIFSIGLSFGYMIKRNFLS